VGQFARRSAAPAAVTTYPQQGETVSPLQRSKCDKPSFSRGERSTLLSMADVCFQGESRKTSALSEYFAV
jgi:hypothetical protein